ncbi:hypothetical protein MtrunA17_Chr3g0141361 [Medicago truncatula]|uniref:Transmembrane protein n=1 Tax=Medicago truncatula TaxID=3880 RepID=A0A396J0S8_MEDTR|nr:hypothetical protein MtrunA17_Chr3g0141361 [Medicago truncatula]
MSNFQVLIAFLLALLLYNSSSALVYSFPQPHPPHYQGAPPPGCHQHVPHLPPKHRHRKIPPPPPPPAAFYFFSPPPPSSHHFP